MTVINTLRIPRTYLTHAGKSKRGNVLVLVIILFLFVSILAMGILSYALTETKIVSYDERHEQAYYLAHSVVSTTEAWISANFNDRVSMAKVIPSAVGEGNAIITNSNLNNSLYTLKVWRDSRVDYSDFIYIEAEATYRDVKASAKLSLTETISGYSIFDDAIYSLGPFSNKNGTAITLYPNPPVPSVSTGANYNAGDTAKIDKAFYPDGESQVNQGRVLTFGKVDPPANVIFTYFDPDPETTWHNDPDILISENTVLNDVVLSGSTVVTIQNTDAVGNPQNIHIMILGDLTIEKSSGSFPTITPSDYNGGKIFIYIYGDLYCMNPAALIVEGHVGPAVSDTTGPAIYFICNGDNGEIEIIGNPYIKAYIYAPKMTVNVGGTTDLYGAVIAKFFGWNGNIGVHYVKPYSFDNSPFANMGLFDEKISIDNQTWRID